MEEISTKTESAPVSRATRVRRCVIGDGIPRILPRRAGPGALMRATEPIRQVPRRFVWGSAVERHQRRWQTGDSHDVRPPPVLGDRNDLDEVRSPSDRFFEAMREVGHEHCERVCWSVERRAFLRGQPSGSSEATREGASTMGGCRDFSEVSRKKNSGCRFVHRICTEHPQLFHSTVSTLNRQTCDGDVSFALFTSRAEHFAGSTPLGIA